MRVIFMCPSSPRPVGGVLAVYGFANGLARRGHHVDLVHLPMWGCLVTGPEDLARFELEPSIEHYFPGGDDRRIVPDADISFGVGSLPNLGLAVSLVQGLLGLGGGIDRAVLRAPCLKVCVSRWLVEAGRLLGVPAVQLAHVPLGLDHRRFRQVTPADERRPLVAMLHGTHPAKGWAVGREVLERVHRQVPEMRAVVFGTADPPEGLPPWLDYLTDPTPEVLARAVYNASQVFLAPSTYEGFGLAGAEAMACGAALVTTDNGGSREYAEHGRTALVAPAHDVATLADHVIGLLADDERRTTMAAAGRDHVQRFDWDRSAVLLEDHLQRYLDQPERFREPPGPDQLADAWGVEELLRRTAPGVPGSEADHAT